MKSIKSDLLIIGGGINGAGVAADAAGRGLSVVLCEQGDLGNYTSSSSTKLIHGGLRYLEQYEFGLVSKALKEREILIKKAPHLIKPLSFILPYDTTMRPAWLIRVGLFLYDFLAWRRSFPRSKKINFKKSFPGHPLKEDFSLGFSYTDCVTDDARLVILNALAAKEKGAQIFTRTQCVSAEYENGSWNVICRNTDTNDSIVIRAKVLVNAAGPWVSSVLNQVLSIDSEARVRWVKGSHIIIPKVSSREEAYLLQNIDQRVIFAIPYERDFTLIGTTELPYEGDPTNVSMSESELHYLLKVANRYFSKSVCAEDVVWSYSGVRALYDDRAATSSKVSRDHHLDLKKIDDNLALISIFGGKITSFRCLAEDVVDVLKPCFPEMGKPWTEKTPLPGGDFRGGTFSNFLETVTERYPWLPEELRFRYAKQYGTLLDTLLKGSTSLSDLGKNLGGGLYERELDYLVSEEWATCLDDIIWRRTKMGLRLSQSQKDAIEAYLVDLRKVH